MDGLLGRVGAWRIVVLEFARKLTSQGKAWAILLTLCSGVVNAQSNPLRFSTPAYDLPQALPSQGVSSEEFERLVGLQGQLPFLSDVPVFPNPQTAPAMNLTEPIGAPSPFSGYLENPPVENPIQNTSQAALVQTIPWWQEQCSSPILTMEMNKVCRASLEQLVWQSMQFSPKVQSILIVPKIQRTDIQIATGEFDRRRVANTNYHDTSDPVGNTLTTGGPNRFNEQFWENSIGVRDRNTFGGKTELSQLFNARDNNSLFFKPNNQADTKFSLNYTQPLMRGSGRYYNTSSIRVAGLKTNQAIATANRELQNHAMDVINTYWELVLHRYLLEQARKGQERLKAIKEQLMNRQGRDLVKTHLSRATAAIAIQQGQIETAKNNILGLQQSLRQLVNAPELDDLNCFEIVPLTLPATELPVFPIEEELIAALNHRGDILTIQETIQIAVVQKNLAVNELRPQLDLDTSSYVRGLNGNNAFARSYGNQFDSGRPSLQAGLTYQSPVRNRSAKANLTSRQLEIAKLQQDYASELGKARADIITAYLSARASYETTMAAIESTLASRDEVDGHKLGFENFYGDNPSPSNVLNDLLDAENRLIIAENSWATKQIQHMLALVKIKYESGTLMTITAE